MERRNIILFSLIALTLVAFALSGCAAPTPNTYSKPKPRSTSTRALGIYYIGTEGQVGHHMYAEPRAGCPVTWQNDNCSHVSGSLPPGLEFHGSRIQGTPEQPGKWYVRVKFTGVKCQSQPYADEFVDIYMNIKGFAPRKIR
jgi:hypothetical protein